MPLYTVNHSYRSSRDGRTFGPFVPGTTVELDEADAEWVDRDSPGALSPVVEHRLVAEHGPELAVKPPAADRQARPGRNRGAK